MNLERLVSKYIGSAEHVFREIKLAEPPISFDAETVVKVVDFAKDYLEDAKYYMERQKFEVSLTSVAYCEGLLEALKLLGAVNFEWPTKPKEPRKEK